MKERRRQISVKTLVTGRDSTSDCKRRQTFAVWNQYHSLDRFADRVRASSLSQIVMLLLAVEAVAPLSLEGRQSTRPGLDPQKALTQYIHEVWETGKTPLEGAIRAILQTRDGHLWVGAQEGLYRYDGDHFAVYNRRNTAAFTSNIIHDLAEDRNGVLWIATNDGLLRYQDGKFARLSREDGLPAQTILSLFVDRKNDLLIGTSGSGVCVLSAGSFFPFRKEEVFLSGGIRSICEDQSGGLWFGTGGSGVVNYRDGLVKHYTTRDGLLSDITRSVSPSKQGGVWVGTQGGLSHIVNGKVTSYRAKDGLSNEVVVRVLEDQNGVLWIGTSGGGLNRLVGGRWSAYTSKERLSNDFVLSLHEDHDGSLWIGTADGLNRFRDAEFSTYTIHEGLTNDVIWCVYEDARRNIWLGTNGSGLLRIKDGLVTSFTSENGLSNNIVRSIVEDREGVLWIGTYGGGLNRLEGGRIFRAFEGILGGQFVYSLLEDRNQNLWIGTSRGLFRRRGGRLTLIEPSEELRAHPVRSILEDRKGDLWFATNGGGLSRWSDGKFTNLSAANGLTDSLLMTLHEDREGTLWIGTFNGGLNRLKDGSIKAVTSKEGLCEDLIYNILEDEQNNLWIGGNRGVSKISIQELNACADGRTKLVRAVLYGKENGLRARECNGGSQPSAWKTHDGRLLFSTVKGVAAVQPNKIRANTVPPAVVLESVTIDNQVVDHAIEGVVPPGAERIEFHYAALSLRIPERLTFKYKLEGYETEWVDAGPRRTATYTNIPPGAYTFQVIAANEDGVWNETGAFWAFTLSPFFFQTRLFYSACAVVLVLLAAGAYAYRVKQYVRRTRELESHVVERTEEVVEQKNKLTEINIELNALLGQLEEKTKQLEHAKRRAEEANQAKSAFLANVSHELRTPLNSVIGFTNILLKNKGKNLRDEDVLYLERILENGVHLLTLINEVLDLEKIESGQTDIQLIPVSLNLLVRQTVAQLEGRYAGKHLLIKIEIPLKVEPLQTDPGRLKQILINLVGNAIKFTERGTIRVRVAVDPINHKPVRIDVVDAGIGIPKEHLAFVFEPFKQADNSTTRRYGGTGLGLSISRTLADMLGYRLEVKSEVGKGSTFSIILAPEARTASYSEEEDGEMLETETGKELPPVQQKPAKSVEQEVKEKILLGLQPFSHGAWAHMNINRIALFGRNLGEATSSRQYERFRIALCEYVDKIHPALETIAQQFQIIRFDPTIVRTMKFHADELAKIAQTLAVNARRSQEEMARLEVEIPKHVDQLLHAFRVIREQVFLEFRCHPEKVLHQILDQWSADERRMKIAYAPSPNTEEIFVAITEPELTEAIESLLQARVGGSLSEGERELSLASKASGDQWTLELRDSSVFIDPKNWRTVFTPPGTDGEDSPLSAVPTILRKYDGEICVKESVEGMGTTYLMRLRMLRP